MKTIYFYKDGLLINTSETSESVKSVEDDGVTLVFDGEPVEVRGSTYQATTKPMEVAKWVF